jgi:eukaryotic-like serine/threonine-protein kinase
MTPERWQQIRDLLEEAQELEPSQRSAFLDHACLSDQSLRREVEGLLAASDDARSTFLQSPVAPHGLIASLDESLAGVGLQAGQLFAERFQLVRRLGEGGMGQVWLAEQTSPVRRQVAIKLIKAGMYDEAVVQRFQSERQSLAIMDHPAIAKVFDAGTPPQGQPYFVMEYVPGLPITEYCDQKKLKIADRLELFIQVCEGVQHAHQKAIIHRDLKPANILVVEVDGKAVPRIIDFGLAKAITPRVDGESRFTQMGHFVGTPGYMSPEQADPNAQGGIQDIDTRSDVYSLGVVLYVLLAGHQPFETGQGQKQPLDELLRKLREEDPPSPSDKVSADRDTSAATAAARGTEPKQLVTLLRGDLDWIAMKALEKDRTRRYGTAAEFAADIKRHLKHEAVLAVPPSLAYRTRKFARRYRVALGSAGAVALVVVVAGVVSIREGIRANREAAVAEAVNEFLQNDLLAQAGASNQSGRNVKPDPHLEVRTALDRAAQRIEGKFAKQPEVEASIRDTMGWTYMDLGLFPESRKQLELALELRRRVLGADDEKTLKTTTRLGHVAYLQGNYAEAEALLSQALQAQRRVLGPEHPDTLTTQNRLAILYRDEGKLAQAEALHEQTLEIRKRLLGPEHPDTLASMGNLAVVYDDDGKYPQAEALYAQSLELRRRVLGPEHPDTLSSMNNLATLYDEEGKYPEAEALNIQILEIRKRVLGPEHPKTLYSMNNLAMVYFHEKKFAEAEELDAQTLEIRKRVLGPEHPDTTFSLYNLSCVAAGRGNKDQAIALLSQAVDHGLPPYADLGIEKDTDLTSLHDDPRFAALVAHAKQVAENKQTAAKDQKAQTQ